MKCVPHVEFVSPLERHSCLCSRPLGSVRLRPVPSWSGDDRPKQSTQADRDLERGRGRLFPSDGGRRGSHRRNPQGLSRHHRPLGGAPRRSRGQRTRRAPLAAFPARSAVQAAIEIQQSVEGHNIELEADRRMQFRIGVNSGDVIEEADGTIYGDGVSIAARLEALAEGGSVCISSTVTMPSRKLAWGFDFLGEHQVKNIAKPVRVYPCAPRPKPISQRSASGPSLPEKPSIAVLPFVNISGDHAHDFLNDGITENIITALSRFRDLSVIASNRLFLQGQGAENTGCGERARREDSYSKAASKNQAPGSR